MITAAISIGFYAVIHGAPTFCCRRLASGQHLLPIGDGGGLRLFHYDVRILWLGAGGHMVLVEWIWRGPLRHNLGRLLSAWRHSRCKPE
jgi:hypothetical protein